MREEIIKVIEKYIYVTEQSVAQELNLNEKEVSQELKKLVDEYLVCKTKKNKYVMATTLGYFRGKLDIKQGGFGFLVVDDGEDVFVSPKGLKGAFNGEEVLVKVDFAKVKNRLEGEVIKNLNPLPISFTGSVHKNKTTVFVINDKGGEDIYISNPPKDIATGIKVVAQINKRATATKSAEGQITRILGHSKDKGVDILVAAYKFGLNPDFKEKTMEEAQNISHEVSVDHRRDWRDEITLTIDGDSAKDFDDAVSLKKLPNGNVILGVHIADVAHYVKFNSDLDKEAYERGTSVYLINKVIPMLPEVLSNDLCSLNTGVDKYTLSCTMEFDSNGNMVDHDIFESVINTRHRLTYNEVNMILDGESIPRLDDIKQLLFDMNELAEKLRKLKFDRGSIDFDLDEAIIDLDENDKVTDVRVAVRGKSEKLIEEFMLKCNTTVAEHFNYMQIPFMYRIHEQPDKERMQALAVFLSNFSIKLKGKITPKLIQNVLSDVSGTAHASVVNNVTLRSLKKAKYAVCPEAHFGLAAEEYCHFTSPIRRYPDLQIHRIIKDTLQGKMTEKYIDFLQNKLDAVANHCSERERNAILAERSVNDMKMTQYMSDKIGDVYEGVISGVTRFGLFVQLHNTIEGMIPLATLNDDYYVYVEEMYYVIGERTKKKISLGDKAKVTVVNADIASSKIEFAFVD